MLTSVGLGMSNSWNSFTSSPNREAEHRQCARHILANFNKRFTGQQYIKLFWRAVRASTVEKFRGVMEKIKSIDTHAYDYLIGRDPTTWSKAFF